MSEAVIVRRISDGKWFSGGSCRLLHFTGFPRSLKSQAEAVALIRCDIGDVLADYEILPAEKTQ